MSILGITIGRTICGAGVGYPMQTSRLMIVDWKLGAIIGGVANLVEEVAFAIIKKNPDLLPSHRWLPVGGAGAAFYALKSNIITSNLSRFLGPISKPNLSFAEVFLFNYLSSTIHTNLGKALNSKRASGGKEF